MVIPALQGNWVDLVILFVVLFYVLEGLERGFWSLVSDLFSFLGSLFIALKTYPYAAQFLIANFTLPTSFAKALGFIMVAIFSQVILGTLGGRVFSKIPERLHYVWWARIGAILPAIVNSGILLAAILTLLVALPISPQIKKDVVESRIGGFLVARTTGLEKTLTEIFGGAIQDTLTFITIKPGSQERININYKPQKLTVDDVSEVKMLAMVNAERAKVGAKPLVLDQKIVSVARQHSRDMWERGYFAHTNPDGEDAADRMKKGGVSFFYAGENLALAPTVELAHQGLMNSEGHRRNILDPNFGRVGIGVIDGGIYGKMFTQNFAD